MRGFIGRRMGWLLLYAHAVAACAAGTSGPPAAEAPASTTSLRTPVVLPPLKATQPHHPRPVSKYTPEQAMCLLVESIDAWRREHGILNRGRNCLLASDHVNQAYLVAGKPVPPEWKATTSLIEELSERQLQGLTVTPAELTALLAQARPAAAAMGCSVAPE